jgi:hypothetical protein
LLTRLGEQKPHGPQSVSTRQLLPVAHAFGVESDAEARHAHGSLAGQSESLAHVSYVHELEHAKGPPKQRPFVPCVHFESSRHVRKPPSGGHAPADVQPGPRAAGPSEPAVRWLIGIRGSHASPAAPASAAPAAAS